MSAIGLGKQVAAAFGREKPRSSITEWVDILTAPGYADEVYDGIPEIIDSINLQPTGPGEASRAIRKKLKHGNAHQQYRALVILKALVENCGHKFQTTFADGQLTDAIRHLATDSTTDPKVKKKLIAVLASWQSQFKDDHNMTIVASLYKQCRPPEPVRRSVDHEALERENEHERKRREEKAAKEEAKRKAKLEKEAEKERLKKEEAARKQRATDKTRRKLFNFEQEKPQVVNSIANASSAASNLINAITLVNTEHDSLQANARVQECLEKAKQARKQIVRYIQLVEDEEFIGSLIETNERIIAALETYDKLSKPDVTEQDVADVQEGLAAANIHGSELNKLQEKQRAAVQRAVRNRIRVGEADDSDPDSRQAQSHLHPDLQDLSFGTLGDQRNLPPPIRPNAPYSSDDDRRGGSLSDFSDYQSDEETSNQHAGPSSRRAYINVSDNEIDGKRGGSKVEEDPFADPFAD
ncbi:hypothetical protein EW146_g2057 [Bondarzewia mesenterica]|uniref:VHS domain-containing protein n=1 Tax=Bondarzewia mesenterica TaxID=1095465 RepID=A0A4S4M864_9AGAM|nr:hypothetical protein EW146_g2057 [Bondarzewia mesenterica]